MLSRRTLLGLGVGAALGAVGLAAVAESTGTDGPRLDASVVDYVDALEPGSPYREPTAAERTVALAALARLDGGRTTDDAVRRLASLGTTVTSTAGYRTASSRPGVARGWGLYAYPQDLATRLVVEVPHPNFDLLTEQVALDVLRRLPAATLAVAGAYRYDADALADVAHEPGSLFHAVVMDTATRHGVPQVQLHGFDDDHAPDIDVIVSAGAGPATPYVRAVADALDDGELALCRAWEEDCHDLGGRTNVQGRACAAAGSTFVHLELSRAVREDATRRDLVARCLTDALRENLR